jgi:hypothetical protein
VFVGEVTWVLLVLHFDDMQSTVNVVYYGGYGIALAGM